MKYLAVACALTATVFVYALFAGLARHAPKHPGNGVSRRDCIPLTLEPHTVACTDRRVYMLPGWVDIGPVTPVPGVPAR